MAETIELTLACDEYELVKPLLDGRVAAQGIRLILQPGVSIAQRHVRMIEHAAFDVCEMSATTYFLARERALPLTALPVFLLRRFRHGDIFVSVRSGIRTANDLIGKKVGGICYQIASNVWARGILADQYEVPHDSIIWVVEREEEIAFDIPPGLQIERLGSGLTLEDALLATDIDALMSPVVPRSILVGDSRVGRLFSDYKALEMAYFRSSGVFPIMHLLAVRQELIERHPWIPVSLYKAFSEAKTLAYQQAAGGRTVPLAWFGAAWEEERRTLGPDPWMYGLAGANVANLQTILRYMRQQGLLHNPMNLTELFGGLG
jgi:4,5-dihydroxyphthalate decarboxylase